MRWISSRLEHMLRLSFPIGLVAVLSVALTSISALANGGQGSLASQISQAIALAWTLSRHRDNAVLLTRIVETIPTGLVTMSGVTAGPGGSRLAA